MEICENNYYQIKIKPKQTKTTEKRKKSEKIVKKKMLNRSKEERK